MRDPPIVGELQTLDRETAYKTFIPADAEERVVSPPADRSVKRVEYWLNGELVGERLFDADGHMEREWPYRAGVLHGVVYRWDEPGKLLSAEPWKNGVPHGTAYHWWDDGQVIGIYTLEEGSGLDLWWSKTPDGAVVLAEVHPMRNGQQHGFEWWLNDDQQSVFIERHWGDGGFHGIERMWNSQDRLARGFPRYWVRSERVSKRQYLKAAATDPSLPPFRPEDNEPERVFSPEVVKHLEPR